MVELRFHGALFLQKDNGYDIRGKLLPPGESPGFLRCSYEERSNRGIRRSGNFPSDNAEGHSRSKVWHSGCVRYIIRRGSKESLNEKQTC